MYLEALLVRRITFLPYLEPYLAPGFRRQPCCKSSLIFSATLSLWNYPKAAGAISLPRRFVLTKTRELENTMVWRHFGDRGID